MFWPTVSYRMSFKVSWFAAQWALKHLQKLLLTDSLQRHCRNNEFVFYLYLFILQVMASDDHRFLSSSLYSSGALVAWDPAPFSADLTQVTITSSCTHRKHFSCVVIAEFTVFFCLFLHKKQTELAVSGSCLQSPHAYSPDNYQWFTWYWRKLKMRRFSGKFCSCASVHTRILWNFIWKKKSCWV